jgi:hypothetical protein
MVAVETGVQIPNQILQLSELRKPGGDQFLDNFAQSLRNFAKVDQDRGFPQIQRFLDQHLVSLKGYVAGEMPVNRSEYRS